MTDGLAGQTKKFVFRSKSKSNGDLNGEYLEINIPEVNTRILVHRLRKIIFMQSCTLSTCIKQEYFVI